MDIRETQAGVDWLLRTMVNFTNHSEQDVSFAITLSVKGSIITGEIISGHEYFMGINEQILSSFGDIPEEEQIEATIFTQLAERYREEDGEGEQRQESAFIHMKNASVFLGEQLSDFKGGYWRGRLESVDAFIFGRASRDEQPAG